MKTLAKTSLVTSVVVFAVSLTGPGSEFLWGFLKPFGALLFVNFFIMNLLANEYALLDEEGNNSSAAKPKAQPKVPTNGSVDPRYARGGALA
ncbi:MAG TPA: hypothetical protein VK615_11245 [Candidatus Binatia bacterium]|nr:hypothetical protein [Candidatus Binatia bacterium]